jgi:hypothetical protein
VALGSGVELGFGVGNGGCVALGSGVELGVGVGNGGVALGSGVELGVGVGNGGCPGETPANPAPRKLIALSLTVSQLAKE